jgi:hypothetical protein
MYNLLELFLSQYQIRTFHFACKASFRSEFGTGWMACTGPAAASYAVTGLHLHLEFPGNPAVGT